MKRYFSLFLCEAAAKDQAVPKFRLTKKVVLQKAQSKHQKTVKIYLMNFQTQKKQTRI